MRNIREDSSYDENQYIVPKGGMQYCKIMLRTSQITWESTKGEYQKYIQ